MYGQSEDCLFLTVMSPAEKSTDPAGYPVFFWMHGGAYEQGLGNCALYNGTTFAQNGIVTVVINYRLGALGFMASKSMEGNYGTTLIMHVFFYLNPTLTLIMVLVCRYVGSETCHAVDSA